MQFDPAHKRPHQSDTHVVYVDEDAGSGITVPKLVSDMVDNKNRFVNRCFDFMFIGLCITAAVAHGMAHSPALPWLLKNTNIILLLFVVQLVVVHVLASAAPNMSPTTATATFVFYSALNGVTLAPIYAVYTEGSIVGCFLSCAAVFFIISCYGYVTKRDLSSAWSIASFALVGLIVAMVVNMLLRSTFFDMLLSCAAILIFTVLLAGDVQRQRRIGEQLKGLGDSAEVTGLAIVEATLLYLNFLNLFLHLLKIFGKLKDGKLEASDLQISQ